MKVPFLKLLIIFAVLVVFVAVYMVEKEKIKESQKPDIHKLLADLQFSQAVIDECKGDAEWVKKSRSNPDCVNGRIKGCMDGWENTYYYDSLKAGKKFPADLGINPSDEFKKYVIAIESSGGCLCKWDGTFIITGMPSGATCQEFFGFIERYNNSCNGFVAVSSTGCC